MKPADPLYLVVDNDPEPECPSEEDGWKLYSFGHRHASFKHPEALGLSLSQGPDGLPDRVPAGLRRKLKAGLAFWLSYFEHGDCVWFLRTGAPLPGTEGDFRWDGVSLAGLLVWEQSSGNLGPKTYAGRREDAAGFLKSYTAWANGDGILWRLSEDPDGGDEGWNPAADLDSAALGIQDELKGYAADRPVVVTGDAADLYLQFKKVAGRVMVGDAADLEDTEVVT